MQAIRRIFAPAFTALALIAVFSFAAGCTNRPEPPAAAETATGDVQESSVPGDGEAQTPASEDDAATLPEGWGAAQALPTTIQQFIEYPVGRFSGVEEIEDNPEAAAFFADLPVLPETAGKEETEQYFTYIYSLLKPDYPDPRDIKADYGQSQLPGGSDAVPAELQKETYNVEIVLDSSGSMANTMDGKTRMELAKEAIADFLSSLPEEANVGLRVYGHKGTGSNKDKKLSCEANELVYEVQPYDQSGLEEAMDAFEPAGWTPLSKAIELAHQDLAAFGGGENNRNILYIVSDGIETCGGDPVQAAEQLKQSDVKPVVNIIGFDLDDQGQQQLKAVAEAAGGTYADVKSQDELKKQFEQSSEDAEKWLEWYLSSREQALETRGDHFDQIIEWRDVYTDKMYACHGGLLDSINYLTEHDKINGDQRNIMLDAYGVLRDIELDEYGKMSDQLFELQDLQFEEAYERIDQMFEPKQP
ncbi:VWA domain-containing protein [Paenibacillus thailandensis]|uniref:VWA domain-containing protein n=1 Tax=Paenibacillus thailandensis TaxID=393250 RepID=A0ABW5QXJ8_9BACL